MFQLPRGVTSTGPPTSEAQARPSAILTAPAPPIDWMFAWRRRRWILLGAGVSLLLGLTAQLAMTPRYRAVSQILIGPTDLLVIDKSVLPPAQTPDASIVVESETKVLTSDSVLRRVVERERLAQDTEFQPRRSATDTIIAALRWIVLLKPVPHPAVDPALTVLRALQRSVTARRTERTYVVDLIVETSNAEKSARIANAVVQAYIAGQAEARGEAARRVTESLTGRLNELRDQVHASEEQIEHYKAEHGIVGATGSLLEQQRLTDLNNQLTAAQSRTADAKARYDQILRLQASGADRGNVTEAVQSTTLGLLRTQYAAAVQREATLTAELGARHPNVADARAQVRSAERLITEEIGRIAAAAYNEYQRALANEQSLAASFSTSKERATETNLALVKLRELEREAEANRAVYESFLVRARETRELERLDSVNVRILSEADPPIDRSWPPNRMMMLVAAIGAGILGGVGCAYAAELASQRSSRAAQPNVTVRQAASAGSPASPKRARDLA
jgi:polysaccharide biosynthesis transport protein